MRPILLMICPNGLKLFSLYQAASNVLPNGHVFYRLGMMYLVGYCVQKDKDISNSYFERAFELLQSSANGGDAEAQADLGYMYYNGHTPTRDRNTDEALKYYKEAALQGYPRALCNLGYIYYNNPWITSNKGLAIEYYQLAAQNGSLVAHSNLGFIFKEKQDYLSAVKHFFAAAKGNEKAREHLMTVFASPNVEAYKQCAIEYLSNSWKEDWTMINPNCKCAILELFLIRSTLSTILFT